MSLATHSLEMQLIHMRLVVSSALPTILASQQFLEVPHARTPQHCPPFADDRPGCLLSSADSASKRTLRCDIGTRVSVSVHTSMLV